MAAPVKFLMMAALLQMGACVPAPEPDPHNIVVQVDQDVNSGCCNGACPCKYKKDCCYFEGEEYPYGSYRTEGCCVLQCDDRKWVSTGMFNDDCCWFDNEPYPNGSIRKLECLELQCVNGNWTVYEIDQECGQSMVGGEPLVYTFDNCHDPISVDGGGCHRMAYHGSLSSPDFGVDACFTTDPLGGRICGGVLGYISCINVVIYFEVDIAVKLTITYNWKGSATIQVHISIGFSFEFSIGFNWVPQTIGSGKSFFGRVFVFEGLLSIPGCAGVGRNCAMVIGSKGLTVGLCETTAFDPIYPWSFIYAMPRLRSPPSRKRSLPASTALHGICQAWTGEDQENGLEYFTAENGTRVYDWQNGTCVYDWRNGTCVYGTSINPNETIIPILRNDLTEGFKVPQDEPTGTTRVYA